MGRVVRPHGLRGQVVVELVSNRPERMAPGSRLHHDRAVLEVTAAVPVDLSGGRQRWLVQFAGVTDRGGAERLRGAVLRAPPLDDPGVLWVHDLVGSVVRDAGGAILGTVEAVEANPASDLLVLDRGTLIPLRFVTGRHDGEIRVDLPPGLLEP